jgi:asparagine synthase (glutamine-hydrolysing)
VSVQFGMWNFDGRPVDRIYAGKVFEQLDRASPDGVSVCAEEGLLLLYGACDTTPLAHRERQPFAAADGALLLWDGRLDAAEPSAGPDPTDLARVGAAWERSGTACFRDLLGDWALSAICRDRRALVLARDFLGSRPLYYLRNRGFAAWSTLLEPLLSVPGERFTLDEEYLAGWFAGYPDASLTPYEEILAVPPASFVRVTPRSVEVETYWKPRLQKLSSLKSDADYEECFRAHFFAAVKRRLRSRGPVAAELSGGLDSSAIVCAADLIAGRGARSVETVSFFDPEEPRWNERPYFLAVEERRGRAGFHLNVGLEGRLLPEHDQGFPVTPAHGALPSPSDQRLSEFLAGGGFRVLLSGVGGDEFTGGVPTGIPELADCVRCGDLVRFLRRAFLWSLAARRPLLHLAAETLATFLPSRNRNPAWPTPWLAGSFRKRHRRTFARDLPRFRWFGPLPSFQANLAALDGIRRQLALAATPGREMRYPFLDRDLLEYLFNIPRSRLVRPGERRSLLRRALRGIVPDLVLDRPSKAFVATSHSKALASDWPRVEKLLDGMRVERCGMVDSGRLLGELEAARRGLDVPLLPLLRVLRVEWWMRHPGFERFPSHGVRGGPDRAAMPRPSRTISQTGQTLEERR